MLGYRIDEKLGKLSMQFRDRGFWRDFDSLLPDESHLAPQSIEHTATLTRSNRERFPRSVLILGQANNKAKIEYWRMERFTLPAALVSDRYIRTEIRQLLTDAEDAQKSLWSACRSYARDILSRGSREPAGKDISAFVDQMPVSPWYWSTLESCFHSVLHDYTVEIGPDVIRYRWLIDVRNAIKSAWEQQCTAVSTGDAWAIRALVKAEKPVRRKIKELGDEITKLDPEKEAL
jgi:CRISPR system Cascade subunit CasA